MAATNINLREKHIIGHNTRERIVNRRAYRAGSSHEISLMGISDAAFGFHFVRLNPNINQLLVCYSGRGQVWIDGGWQACGAGTAYLTPPSVPHAYRALRGRRWGLCWVAYAEGSGKPALHLDKPIMVRINPQSLLAAITGLYRESINLADPAVMNCWMELVEVSVRRIAQPGREENRLQHVWEAMNADLARPWSVDDMAELADMSDEHLRRLSNCSTGYSPMKYLTRLRMQRASALLASTDRTIENIARAVGYENPFSFSTAFKRYAGLPPSAYRSNAAVTPKKE